MNHFFQKKLLLIALSAVLILAGCGSGKDTPSASSADASESGAVSSQPPVSSSADISSSGLPASSVPQAVSSSAASSAVKPVSSRPAVSSAVPDPVEYDIPLSELPFRDICVLPDSASKRYYIVGFQRAAGAAQEVICFESKDMRNWGNYRVALTNNMEYKQNWAAEIHYYKGGYYMFANLQSYDAGDQRGCYIYKADKPYGPYKKYSDRITPANWKCLDGTLYTDESGTPYMVYCREWDVLPGGNGEMYAVELSEDLKSAAGEHKLLFKAKDNTLSADGVTDAPYLYKANNGDLVMVWSKYIGGKYAIVSARSKNGVMGTWTHDAAALYTDDGGHAMIFKDFSGKLKIAFHTQSSRSGSETPVIYDLLDQNGKLSIQTTKP